VDVKRRSRWQGRVKDEGRLGSEVDLSGGFRQGLGAFIYPQ